MSRFTAMGEMASTLAHELNQPLTAVASYLNGCRRLLDGTESVHNLMLRDAIARRICRVNAMFDEGPKKTESNSSTKDMAIPSVTVSSSGRS